MPSQFAITESHKQAQTEFGSGSDLRKSLVWKGDHSRCEQGHADGRCLSINAWRLDGEIHIVPSVVGRPTNRRFASTVHYERPGQEKEDEPAWQAKGFRSASETKFGVPIPEVIAKLRERGVEELKNGMQFSGKPRFQDVQSAMSEWLASFDKANAALVEKAKTLDAKARGLDADTNTLDAGKPVKGKRADG